MDSNLRKSPSSSSSPSLQTLATQLQMRTFGHLAMVSEGSFMLPSFRILQQPTNHQHASSQPRAHVPIPQPTIFCKRIKLLNSCPIPSEIETLYTLFGRGALFTTPKVKKSCVFRGAEMKFGLSSRQEISWRPG